MNSIYPQERDSGITSIGNVPWGTSFCYFYNSEEGLFATFMDYLRAGLENDEYCIWVTSSRPTQEMLKSSDSAFRRYLERGQIEVIPLSQYSGEKSREETIISWLDHAISRGFAGLRLAVEVFPKKRGGKVTRRSEEIGAVGRYNVIAAFAYPRDSIDAAGLMEVVKDHRFALVQDTDKQEVIEASEAKIARDALRISEEKLSSLFDHMSEGFAYQRIVLDSSGKPCDYIFLEVNEAFERLTGLKAEDIIGRRVTEVLPGIENDPADWIGRYGEVALTEKPVRFESYSEPLRRWYSASAFSPHKGFFAVAFSDITERKESEDMLLKANTEWERTFNSVPDLITVLDTRHTVIRANKAMAERLGTTPDKCVGLHCYQMVHGLPHPPDFCPHSLTCRDIKEHVSEIHEPRLSGDFMVSTTPLLDEEGRLVGSIHVARDITERKQWEEQLRQRTIELEASNRELEAFSYSVSHDLRAPLRSMEGFSDALLEDYADKLDEEGKRYLGYVRDSSELMARLIDDLLKLSRVTRSEMSYKRVNISEMAEKILAEIAKTEPDRKARLNIPPDIFTRADRNLLRLALENLLGNAWKFTSKTDSPEIEVGTINHNGKKAYFVRDNGVGFDMTYADKLFKPFQRLHKSTDFEGTGIGLATVQRVVRRHGGEVWAESKIGEGATFYFTLS